MVRRTGSAWVALGLLLICVAAVRGQSEGDIVKTITQYANPPGLAAGTPAGSYALGEAESIDYFSGHLNYELPLVQVGGRGEAGYTVSLKIPSRWEASSVVNCHAISEGYHCDPTKFSAEFDNPQAATVGYGPGLVRKRNNGTFGLCYDYRTNPIPEIYGMTSSRSTLVFIDSRGTEHELFDKSQFDGQYHAPAANGCVASEYPPSRGRIFASRDGSALSFVADDDLLDDSRLGMASLYPASGGRLYFPNGTMYRVDTVGRVQYIRDRFGNITTFEYGGPYDKVVKVTDPAGRETLITYSPEIDTISYPAANGGRNTIEIGYSGLANRLRADLQGTGIRTYHELFSEVNDSCAEHVPPLPRTNCLVNPMLPAYVTLPNGKQYQFRYNSYGELAEVGLPTGGRFEYDWAGGEAGTQPDGYYASSASGLALIHRVVKQRRAYTQSSGGAAARVTYYEPGTLTPGASRDVAETQNTASAPRLESHTYNGSPVTSSFLQPGYDPYWDHGKETKTEIRGGGALLETAENEWAQLSNLTPVLKSATRKVKHGSGELWAKTEHSYDLFANIVETTETDWGAGTVGAVIRKQSTAYVTDTTYTHANETNPANYTVHLRRLPLSAATYKVNSGVATQEARTEYLYDEGAYPESNCTGLARHDTSLPGPPFNSTQYLIDNPARRNTSFVQFGNVTTRRSWVSGSSYISTNAKYDLAGNAIWSQDGNSTISTAIYGTLYACAYPSQVKIEKGSSQVSSTLTWDLPAGKMLTHTDAHDVKTVYGYEASLGRMISRVSAFQTADENKATAVYDDVNRTVTTGQDLRMSGGAAIQKETVTIYDELGRLYEERRKTDGADIVVRTEYDGLGRVLRRSLPAATPTHWETFAYDALGRVTSKTWGDGASEQTQYQVAEIGLAAEQTKVIDAAGKWRVLATDALGRLVRVKEPAGSGGAAVETGYAYDSMNNLLSVDEGGRMRSFAYDRLGRLLSANNPESGTVNYVYDNNGNLTARTDARGVVTTTAYDWLNRPLTKTYSDGATPGVGYSYQSLRLAAVSTGGAVSQAFTYTPGGRIATSTQTTGGVSYPFTYGYYMDGSLASVSYPSGRTVSYPSVDRAGRLTEVTGTLGGVSKSYVSAMAYNEHGLLAATTLGNALTERWSYNLTRQQPYEVRLGTAGNDGSHLTLQFAYCTNQYSGASCAANNGNILAQWNYANNHIEHYFYDAVNRLSEVTDFAGTPYGFSQSYGLDRFGNRWLAANSGLTVDPRTPTSQSYINATNNRLTGSNYGYDAAGNQTKHGGWTLAYDAENRLVSSLPNGGNATTYAYDGEGRRVKKTTNGVATWFVYNAMGELAAEYEATPPSSALVTQFVTTDHLGSTRLVTDASGNVVSRHDYLPFGEEIPAGYGGRTAAMKYVANPGLTQRFTGKERDTETGLDYFGARYLSGVLGRWTSPDWSEKPEPVPYANFANPQTLNLYGYVQNNPVTAIDPDGHCCLEEVRSAFSYMKTVTYFKAGGGVGLGATAKVGVMTLDAGIKRTVETTISNSVSSKVSTREAGISATVGPVTVGLKASQETTTAEKDQILRDPKVGQWEVVPGFALENISSETGRVGIGAEGYLMFGGGIEIGVDALKIARDLKVALIPPPPPLPPPPPPKPIGCQPDRPCQ